MAYFPEPSRFAPRGYQWNFLKPTTTLTVFGTVTGSMSGSPSYSAPDSTVTATAAKFFPTMIGQSFVEDTGGSSYTINGYTSSTVITVSGNASAESGAFTITPDYAYRLPDSFGFMLGPFTYAPAASAQATPITEVNEGQIRQWREAGSTSGQPTHYAIRPVAATGASGQRFEVLFWPNVDGEYVMHYRYAVLPDLLVDTTAEYPWGGAAHGEMILAACRAALEFDQDGQKGVHYADFTARLSASIARDTQLAPKQYGYMGGTRIEARHSGTTTFTVEGTALEL